MKVYCLFFCNLMNKILEFVTLGVSQFRLWTQMQHMYVEFQLQSLFLKTCLRGGNSRMILYSFDADSLEAQLLTAWKNNDE